MEHDTDDPITTSRYDDALVWASELHRFQLRKGTRIPYVSHLVTVSALVLENGGDEDQAIAGLLHDSIEDAGLSEQDITTRFGDEVARIVVACTDVLPPDHELAKLPRAQSWRPRKELYLAHLKGLDDRALLVSLADKVHNGRSLAADVASAGPSYLDRFNGGADGTRWYYRRLHDLIADRADPNLSALLADLAESLDKIGATPEVAAAFEAT